MNKEILNMLQGCVKPPYKNHNRNKKLLKIYLLRKLANLEPAKALDQDFTALQHSFDPILLAMRSILVEKGAGYGDHIKNSHSDNIYVQYLQAYCEVKRKFVRLRTMFENRLLPSEQFPYDAALETLCDIANNALLAIDILMSDEDSLKSSLERNNLPDPGQ